MAPRPLAILHACGFTTEAAVPATRSSIYHWRDRFPITGDNFYHLRCAGIAGGVTASQVIWVKAARAETGISLYGNPVINNSPALQFNHMETGTYRVNLLNASWQVLMTGLLLHHRGTALQRFLLKEGKPAGNYLLQVVHPVKATTTLTILIGE